MVLKSYFDAGNKADSTQYDVLSLAVASGTRAEWEPFEAQWRMVLNRHKVPYLHTTDAVAREGIYKGWTERQSDRLLKDCARVAARHFIRPQLDENDPGKFGIYCCVISIVLKDFVQHRDDNPDAISNADEGCFRQALSDTLTWSTERFAACDQIHCFFDRGEPFYGYLVNLLQSKKASKEAWLLNRITEYTESDSRTLPALQLADLFAWVDSHRSEPWNPHWKNKVIGLPYYREWMDKTNLHAVNSEHQEAWNSWKMPKRRPTK